MSRSLKIVKLCAALLLAAALLFPSLLKAQDVASVFNDANKLYEQGRFADAASAYEKLIAQKKISPQIYFNLGNAFLKSGQVGRAIAAYRAAEKLSPRDPDIQSNLQFAREQAGGGSAPTQSFWFRITSKLTLNEWTMLTSILVAILFVLLALRQWRANWQHSFRAPLFVFGIACLMCLIGLAGAIYRAFYLRSAVVIVPEAVVRPGPFDESPSAFTLRDGADVSVVGQKDNWLKITDASQRTGWMPKRNVIVIGNEK